MQSGTSRKLATLALAGLAVAVFVYRNHRGFAPAGGRGEPGVLALGSSSFQDGRIPATFTCDGSNASPALAWSAPPPGTRSFALIAADLDAPSGSFVHWVIFNLPAETRTLPEALPPAPELPDGTRQGRNDFGRIGYGGPCPSDHNGHRYVFSLAALDATVNVPPGALAAQVEQATEEHVLARGTLTGVFSH